MTRRFHPLLQRIQNTIRARCPVSGVRCRVSRGTDRIVDDALVRLMGQAEFSRYPMPRAAWDGRPVRLIGQAEFRCPVSGVRQTESASLLSFPRRRESTGKDEG
jgi:hypothetical protein